LFKGVISKERALDCGSGIGRITKELLRKEFEKVDLID
jgi:16S rRNA A1518/A1519 N6-dimethyltransferase RsmA/KsgA/DIM1 with predicted DNA glycosylase/AP lyase activity